MRQILIEKYIEPSEVPIRIDSWYVRREKWTNEYGELHGILGHPAYVVYRYGEMYAQGWYKKGEHHRDKKLPAIIHYGNNEIASSTFLQKRPANKKNIILFPS